MDEQLTKMLKRVRGLLAKAQHENTPEAEADTATRMAAEIMAKYSIDAAMLAASADKTEVPCDKVIEFDEPYAKQHVWLYCAILRAFRGDAIIIQKPTRGRYINHDSYKLRVYAFEADLLAVDILYTSLLLQAANKLKNPPPYEHAKTWRVSFWSGFTAVVGERLMQVNATEASTRTPGTDIVLRDRALVVKEKRAADYPRTKKLAGSTSRSAKGYYSGADAGRKADLHNTSNVGQGRRTALV